MYVSVWSCVCVCTCWTISKLSITMTLHPYIFQYEDILLYNFNRVSRPRKNKSNSYSNFSPHSNFPPYPKNGSIVFDCYRPFYYRASFLPLSPVTLAFACIGPAVYYCPTVSIWELWLEGAREEKGAEHRVAESQVATPSHSDRRKKPGPSPTPPLIHFPHPWALWSPAGLLAAAQHADDTSGGTSWPWLFPPLWMPSSLTSRWVAPISCRPLLRETFLKHFI